MPDYYIFHQNLRVFGGKSTSRNDTFNGAMMDICTKFNLGKVAVAGFTEVMGTGSLDALANMSDLLDSDLTKPILFACGFTAIKNEDPEYIAISTNKEFKIEIAGRVLRVRPNAYADAKWTCYSAGDLSLGDFPNNTVPDSRGLAYLGGTLKDTNSKTKRVIVGFMHNMYGLGDRSEAFTALEKIKQLVWAKHSLPNVVTIFGGDFNVAPRDTKGGSHTICAMEIDGVTPTPTTKHHAYDFWLSSFNIPNSNAKVFAETRDVTLGLSDHAGVALLLPLDTM